MPRTCMQFPAALGRSQGEHHVSTPALSPDRVTGTSRAMGLREPHKAQQLCQKTEAFWFEVASVW
jgi:hypothetical protein